MSEKLVIETSNLTKYYGKARGIENLNLEVTEGEIYGLLGPNGAGKTTTLRVLLDMIRRSSGEAKIFGMDVQENSREIQQRLTYLPGELGLYKSKSARRVLNYLLGLYNRPIPSRRIDELAGRLGLALERKVKELSKGNKQKIGIILALAPEVDLLMLDEPTSGLDPLITQEFYKILHEQQFETGCTVLLSSHLLQEVEKVAHRVGIIRAGTLVEVATVQQLKKLALKHVVVETPENDQLEPLSRKLSNEMAQNPKLELNQLSFLCKRDSLPRVMDILSKEKIQDVDISSPDLEDIFLKYYQVEAREVA
ncbi:MAG: ABC transporter ATP-binding protein [Candidatus Hodarchaeota archaeon]